jgi:hypothetical protein
VIRSDQSAFRELGLAGIAAAEGMPLFVIVDPAGQVVESIRAPMESDILAALEVSKRAPAPAR